MSDTQRLEQAVEHQRGETAEWLYRAVLALNGLGVLILTRKGLSGQVDEADIKMEESMHQTIWPLWLAAYPYAEPPLIGWQIADRSKVEKRVT